MAEEGDDMNYPVLVTQANGVCEVRIRELLLSVRDADLARAYEELMKRRNEIVEWARSIDTLDELPIPQWPAMIATATTDHSVSWLRRLRSRFF